MTTRPIARLVVSVVDYRGRPVAAAGLGPWLRRVAPREATGDVAVALVGDRRMRALNRQFRGKDHATDVLSFPAGSGSGRRRASRSGASASPATRRLGDIVIATGVASRQAARLGHGLRDELRVLALHGLLHLLGYDHQRDGGAMARAERRLGVRGSLKAGLLGRIG